MGSQWILLLLSLILTSASSDLQHREKRSLSCRLGQASCKWSCRLRGYIRGSCGEDNKCQCTERVSATALMRYFSDKWSDKFPDLRVISDMMEAVLKRNDSTCDKSRSDGKWRPFPLLLGALFKAHEDVKMSESDSEMVTERESDDEMIRVLGHFWHLITAADTILRTGLSDGKNEAEVRDILEDNKGDYAERVGINKEDVVWVWSAELDRSSDLVSQHVPDHVVTIHHQERQVILTLLGTRVWPHPQPLDIMMDLMANTRPFLGGLAHSGLAQGATNIVSTAFPHIRAELDKHPGYELLIIGYSLGAGLAQLIALDCEVGECRHMMPRDINIRVLGYGSPPVYTPGVASTDPVPQLDNVILVSNSEDGIGGLSLNNLNEVLHQICLVENLNIRRRDLLRLLFSDSDEESKEYIELVDKMDLEDGKEGKQYEVERIEFQTDDSLPKNDEDNILSSITKELSNTTMATDEPELFHLGSTLIVIERKDLDPKSFSMSEHHGVNATLKFSNNLHLSPSMLIDHLPDGYNSLFGNIEDFSSTELKKARLQVNVLDNLMKKNQKSQNQKKKGKWGRFKTNVKNFFKGIG